MYEIFEQLLLKKGITTYKISKDTGIAQSVFSNWKSGVSKPKQEKLRIIASYFDVTVDYLLGTENEKEKEQLNNIFEEYQTKAIELIAQMCKKERIEQDFTEKFVAANTDIPVSDYVDFESSFTNIGTDNIVKVLNFYKINLNYAIGYLTGTLLDRKMPKNEYSNSLDRLSYTGKLKDALLILGELSRDEIIEIYNTDPHISENSKNIDDLIDKLKRLKNEYK